MRLLEAVPLPVREFFQRVHSRMARVGERLQSRVVWAGLVVIYLFGVGFTRLIASVFYRRHLTLYKTSDSPSAWKVPVGYSAERERLIKQI
jgi:hypothetical protein